MYRESADELERRHAKLRARLDELRPQLTALRAIESEARSIEQLIATESAAVERRLTLPMLDNLRVASPCSESWDKMTGDDRVRFCDRCRKNVYDLSSLTREQAEALVFAREGAMCVRFYRRPDGAILTADCPTGMRRRRRFRGFAAGVLAGILTAIGLRGGNPPTAGSRSVSTVRDWSHGLVRRSRGLEALGAIRGRQAEPSRFTGFEIVDRNR